MGKILNYFNWFTQKRSECLKLVCAWKELWEKCCSVVRRRCALAVSWSWNSQRSWWRGADAEGANTVWALGKATSVQPKVFHDWRHAPHWGSTRIWWGNLKQVSGTGCRLVVDKIMRLHCTSVQVIKEVSSLALPWKKYIYINYTQCN